MDYQKSKLNKVVRNSQKAAYDKKTIHAILDASEVCHIAFIHEGRAFVQPINFGRENEKIYLHGSLNNRMTNAIIAAKEVCLNVMILDAMKLTRSAYHHSVNYRSVMVFGNVRELTDKEAKLQGLKSIINHFVPNRWEHCRKPTDKELKITRVIEISINTASAKIANSPPDDNEEYRLLNYWAGEIQVKPSYAYPVPDTYMDKNSTIPNHVLDFYHKKNQVD